MLNWIKNKNIFYSLGYILLVIISFNIFWQSQINECHFLSNWPFCEGLVSGNCVKLAISSFTILLVVIFFIIYSIKSNKAYFNSDTNILKSKKFIVFWLICAFLCIPFASIDSVYYFNVGRTIVDGINPYVSNWEIINQFSSTMINKTNGLMYGPLIAILMAFVYFISFGNYWLFLFIWKILMLLSLLFLGKIIKILFNVINLKFNNKMFWVYWLSLPLILFEWLINAHFDGFWLFFVLLAVLFSIKRKWFLVLPMLTIGIWIKFIPLLMLPWFILWWWQEVEKSNILNMTIQMIGGVFISTIITIFSWIYFWQGPVVFKPILVQSKWAVNSVFSLIYYLLKPIFVNIFALNGHFILTRVVHMILLIVLVYFVWPYIKQVVLILFKKSRLSSLDYIQAIFITILAYLVVWQKSFWPWYYAWLFPFGLLLVQNKSSIWLKKILFWISAVPLLFYVFQFWQRAGESNLWFNMYVVFIINTTVLYFLFQWRRRNYDC